MTTEESISVKLPEITTDKKPKFDDHISYA